eukprot:767704-Hanusia_phi.AAC.10
MPGRGPGLAGTVSRAALLAGGCPGTESFAGASTALVSSTTRWHHPGVRRSDPITRRVTVTVAPAARHAAVST